MKVPVIINNRNLLTWPKAMVRDLRKWKGIGDIYIVDNGSTYEPLLEWYATKPCEVISLGVNAGHQAPWLCGLVQKLGEPYYAVTDPDLDLSKTSKQTIVRCVEWLQEFPYVGKVGLSLRWDDVPPRSSYYTHVNTYEAQRQKSSPIVKAAKVDVAIDTTFAVYNRQEYFIGGVSLLESARHIPWYYSEKERKADKEFSQYLASASAASSYKTFLNL
jgi:glycosyltransferase involved in cell wall biosynthesis